MAENLNWAGDDGNLGWCYGNESGNCDVYGRLYDWSMVMGFTTTCNFTLCADQVQSRHQGICPDGWHVPSDAEWTILVNFVGASTAGTQLKAASPQWNGTDAHGFSALPGGRRWSNDFGNVGSDGYWWSATEFNMTDAWLRNMDSINSNVGTYSNGKFSLGFSLRCAQDYAP
jgi:uncharacterized protein (TIGR02145 family)